MTSFNPGVRVRWYRPSLSTLRAPGLRDDVYRADDGDDGEQRDEQGGDQ
jgi:hypothetical protein